MKKIAVVLDTNVIISAILFGGIPRKIMELVISGKVELKISNEIIDELAAVLRGKKFQFPEIAVEEVNSELRLLAEVVFPKKRIAVIKSDPADNKIIECAIEARAKYIISGDPDLLNLGSYETIKILTPRSFVEEIGL